MRKETLAAIIVPLIFVTVMVLAACEAQAQQRSIVTPPVFSPQGVVQVQAGVPQDFEFVDIRADGVAVDWYMLVYNGGKTQFLAARPDDVCPVVAATEIRTCTFTVDLPAGSYTYQIFAQARFLRFELASGGIGTTISFTPPTALMSGEPLDPAFPLTYRFEYGPASGNWPHWVELPEGSTHVVDIPPGDWYAIIRARYQGRLSDQSNEITVSVVQPQPTPTIELL
jgi:hypothetical protein